ncbi:MAG: N-acetylmuramoyl-L-alanine amidase family protein, partial [Actinomycetota bacterium]
MEGKAMKPEHAEVPPAEILRDDVWIDHGGDENDADPNLVPEPLTESEMAPVDRSVESPSVTRAAARRPVVVVQKGHCDRRTGKTGTAREQEFNRALGQRLVPRLQGRGYAVHLLLADDPVPPSDVFIALHCDGSEHRDARGASVGYPDAEGGRLAAAWKRAHQRHGFPGGFRPDNYTQGLSRYYGFKHSRARFRVVVEHGFLTHAAEQAWLFSHLDDCAEAHVDAIAQVLGHQQPHEHDEEEEFEMFAFTDPKNGCKVLCDKSGAVFAFGRDGAVGGHYLGGLNIHPEFGAGADR